MYESTNIKQVELPVQLLLDYAKRYPEPFEAWANFIADYDGDYFGKIWANIRDRIYYKQYTTAEELQKLQYILDFYFCHGEYHGFALQRVLQEYHRLKIIFSGHPNPDFDSIGTALLTLYKAFQSPYLGHARLSLSYQGKVAEYILNVIDDIVLGAERGTRSFIRKLLQARETYQPQVKDVMTLYKDCRKVTKETELSRVIGQMEKEQLQLISVLDKDDKYLGCVRIEEAYHYFYHLYQQGYLTKKASGEAFTVAGFLAWKNIIQHKQVDPSTSLRDKDLLRQLKTAGSIPVLRQQKFQGLITRGHLDKTGVFVYMVDTQDWQTLQGVSEDMIIGYMDHHPRQESVVQTLNLLSGQFESTGACVTLAAKDYVVHEQTVYWPKKLILIAMAALADDTDFFNIDEGKATPTDIAVYRTLVARYYADEPDFDAKNAACLLYYQEKMSNYLRELISSNRQKDVSRILRLSHKHKDALAGLLVDHKVDPGMKDLPFTYWIGQIKIDIQNYLQWNAVDFKDWFVQKIREESKIRRDYRLNKANMFFFTSAEKEAAGQYDELLIYTKLPGKMIPLSIYIIQHMQKLSGEFFDRSLIGAYRRVLPGRAQVFPPDIAKKICAEYAPELIASLFFSAQDGSLVLKKEVAVSEQKSLTDLDLVLEIFLKFVWNETLSLQELKQERSKYQDAVQKIYDPHLIILKYPAATVTSRKRQIQSIMTTALDRVYGEA